MKKYLPLLVISLFVCIMAGVAINKHPQKVSAQTGSFTFGAAGDFSSTSNTDKVLTAFKNGGLNFALGVGDLSYDTQGSPAGWGSYVKNIIGSVPFVFVMGNHDASKVDQFVSALPDPISNAQGSYGKQYYFDYPATAPLARFIMISPVDGTKDINWFNTTVDSARSAGIKWIFVGMHQPCVTTGQKTCEIGQDMMDAMTSKKVDVILFGHDHNYQRSKQVTCAKADTFSASCVVANGPTFTKGAGSVMVIVGTGGNSFYGTNSSDSEAGYFAALNSNTYGFAKFTVSATQIQESFVAASGSFSDSFTINDNTTPTTQPTGVVPTFQCVGGSAQPPCATIPPTGMTPTASPSNANPSTAPSGGVNPTSGSTQPSPTTNPCAVSNSDADSVSGLSHKHHRKHRGGGGGFLEQFFQFLLQLLQQLFQKFGIQFPGLPGNPGGGGTPCPSPTTEQPLVSPTQSPGQPTTQPSNAASPTTGTSPTTATTVAPTGGTGNPTTTTCGSSANTPSSPVTGYKITGCEDFNESSMPNTYSPYNGGGDSTVVGGGRKPEQCTVGSGMLTLTQLADGSTCGGSMSFSQKYGYWEVRMRTYGTGGSGSAPHPVLILWPSTDKWADGELDYFESDIGEKGMNVFLHCVGNPSSNCYNTSSDVDITQWHTYGFEWTSAGFVGYIDGKQIYTTDGKGSNPSVAMTQTIQLDNLSGNTPVAPGKMDVDWVHMYSK